MSLSESLTHSVSTLSLRRRRPPTAFLTYDLVQDILSYLPMEIATDGVLLKALFPYLDIRDLIRNRQNPLYLLSQLVSDPSRLLEVMLISETVLSGSRAVDYFMPGVADADSDWDFYCSDNYYKKAYFLHYMESIGLRPESEVERESSQATGDIYASMGFKLLCGRIERRGNAHKVQLISVSEQSAIGCILRFDLSAVQCFIAGYGAASLYSCLTRRSKSVVWTGRRIEQVAQRQDKYTSRGFRLLSSVDDTDSSICRIKLTGHKVRHIGDGDCCTIGYSAKKYYHGRYTSAASTYLRMCIFNTWVEYRRHLSPIDTSGIQHDFWQRSRYDEQVSVQLAQWMTNSGLVSFVTGQRPGVGPDARSYLATAVDPTCGSLYFIIDKSFAVLQPPSILSDGIEWLGSPNLEDIDEIAEHIKHLSRFDELI